MSGSQDTDEFIGEFNGLNISTPNPTQMEQPEQNEKHRRKAPSQPNQPSPVRKWQNAIDAPIDPRYPGLIMQLDSRGVSHEQLGKEVQAIYAGLTMVEAKAISLDKAKMEAAQQGPLPSTAFY